VGKPRSARDNRRSGSIEWGHLEDGLAGGIQDQLDRKTLLSIRERKYVEHTWLVSCSRLTGDVARGVS